MSKSATFQKEIISFADVKSAPYNPRIMPDKEKKKLRRSLEKFGYVDPMIFNRKTGNIVGGNQRFNELKSMGYDSAEFVVIDVSLEQEKMLNIALNKIMGRWDDERLASLFTELEMTDADITLTGFDDDILKKLASKEEGINFTSIFEVIIECDNEEQQKVLYDRFIKENLKCRVLTS